MPEDLELSPEHLQILQKLREIFLSEKPTDHADYWQDRAHLDAYDQILGARIGWKWDQVLSELESRAHLSFPSSLEIVDWGCGTGRATRSFLNFIRERGLDVPVKNIILTDRSTLASEWAQRRLLEENPELRPEQVSTDFSLMVDRKLQDPSAFRLVLLSHVVGELASDSLGRLLSILKNFADAVIWVDAGTHDLSKKLGQVRDNLKSTFAPLAPCTHAKPCPMLLGENQRHWCHFFAKAPAGVANDPLWNDAAHSLGIDLRSIPYSYLFLKNKKHLSLAERISFTHRAIGKPRVYKGYLKLQTCSADFGVDEFRLQKRDDAELFKALAKDKSPVPALWDLTGQDLKPHR